jgi:hypothetical protein
MSKDHIPILELGHGDAAHAALRMGAVGGAFAAAMAAGENTARCRADLIDREQALADTLRAVARGALVGACGGAASATLGGPAAVRLVTFVTVAATVSFLTEVKPAGTAAAAESGL